MAQKGGYLEFKKIDSNSGQLLRAYFSGSKKWLCTPDREVKISGKDANKSTNIILITVCYPSNLNVWSLEPVPNVLPTAV